MSGGLVPDLSSLVSLARSQKLDLRPVILRVQTDLFVCAPARDPGSIEAFAALATGLLPTVDDDTAAIVARKLAPIEDTPESVLALLAARGGASRQAVVAAAPCLSAVVMDAALVDGADLGPTLAGRAALDEATLGELVARADAVVDLVLAANARLALPPPAIEALVRRGRLRPALAHLLLARRELAPAELAPLYLHADSTRRAEIRTGLAGIASLRGASSLLSRPDPSSCDRLLDLAEAGDLDAFGAELAGFLGLAAVPDWRFDRPSHHELLAFALLALGLSDEDGIRIFLTLHPAIARSVRVVFRLAELVRSTPRTTAIHLVEATLDVATHVRPAGRHRPHLSAGEPPLRPGAMQVSPERRSLPDRSRRAS